MKRTENATYMEPEEYEAYLKAQKEQMDELQAYYESLKENGKKIEGPTLYEMNQQIINDMPTLDEDWVHKCSGKIFKWLSENPDSYYMLLCNEINYYTLFHITTARIQSDKLLISRGAMRDLADEIIDIILNLGNVKIIEEDNNGAISVWSSFKPPYYEELSDEAKVDADKVHCFYLFPYGKGVVEV